jgi:hypothetical protein
LNAALRYCHFLYLACIIIYLQVIDTYADITAIGPKARKRRSITCRKETSLLYAREGVAYVYVIAFLLDIVFDSFGKFVIEIVPQMTAA